MKKFGFGVLVFFAFIGGCSVMTSGIQIIHVTSGHCGGKECDWENCPLTQKAEYKWLWGWILKEAFNPPKTVK